MDLNEVKSFCNNHFKSVGISGCLAYAGVERRLTYGNYLVEGSNGSPSRPANSLFSYIHVAAQSV